MPSETYYGQPTTGSIGKHLPKEIVRIERDYTHAEVCQYVNGLIRNSQQILDDVSPRARIAADARGVLGLCRERQRPPEGGVLVQGGHQGQSHCRGHVVDQSGVAYWSFREGKRLECLR